MKKIHGAPNPRRRASFGRMGVDLKSGKTLASNALLVLFLRLKIARRSALKLDLHPAGLEPATL
jgi:hypothetical protein